MNDASRLDELMAQMLGEDVIKLVTKKSVVKCVESQVKLSRTAMKRKLREDALKEIEIEDSEDGIVNDGANDSDSQDSGSDDSQDLMGNFHDNSDSNTSDSDSECGEEELTLQSSAFTPLVIIFEDIKVKPSLFGTKSQKRSFMSSSMKVHSAVPIAPKTRLSPEDVQQDAYST